MIISVACWTHITIDGHTITNLYILRMSFYIIMFDLYVICLILPIACCSANFKGYWNSEYCFKTYLAQPYVLLYYIILLEVLYSTYNDICSFVPLQTWYEFSFLLQYFVITYVRITIDIVTVQGLETGIASVLRLTSQHISLVDHSHTIVHNRVFYLVYIQGVAIHLIKRHGAPHAYLRK